MVKIGLAVAKQVGRPQDASAPARRLFGDLVSMARPTDSHGRTELQLNATRPAESAALLALATRLRHLAMAACLKLCVFAIVDRNRLADTGPSVVSY